jgi:hypothetical protein
MAKFEMQGFEAYASQLKRLSDKAESMIKRAVFVGAKEITDAVRAEIAALPEVSVNPPTGGQLNGVFSYEKQGLLSGMGLAKMQNSAGFINTQLGFEGYNRMKSKSYPNGHPNALIARAVNSGTSYRRKIPFINRAVKAAQAAAEAAMRAQLDTDIQNETK